MQVHELLNERLSNDWADKAKEAFEGLFGAGTGRFPSNAAGSTKARVPGFKEGSTGVPFAALVNSGTTDSGAYGGMSLVLFPTAEGPSLISMVVGTQGLSPDEQVLGAPGHGRRVQAICDYLNQRAGRQVAWAKSDPTRIDLDMPKSVKDWLGPAHRAAVERYGREIYAVFDPAQAPELAAVAANAFLDLAMRERGFSPLKRFEEDSQRVEAAYLDVLMPVIAENNLGALLAERRYVILEGPPGTGKTRLTQLLMASQYGGHGATIQFHANTTYESFVGGLAPKPSRSEVGLQFEPLAGHLMRAAAEALKTPDKPYLLVVDEINRADLAKVLGEAIFLLEAREAGNRRLELAHDFGEPFGRSLWLPPNLHLLGTMNSADRSIAILDVAVRRRFAFVKLWPQASVVSAFGGPVATEAYSKLRNIFLDHASDEILSFMPGHSYFLEPDDRVGRSLRSNLVPLLEEYLAQGYVAGFGEEIRGFLQWVRSLP